MRILLIEDEPDLALWLTRSLEKKGFAVEWANDGLVAHHRLQVEEFEALVLDLGLPSLDGRALLQRLRSNDNRTPVLILTARDSLQERVETLECGADDFLPKPFQIEELVARINALIRRSRGKDKPRMACAGLVYDLSSQRFSLDGVALSVSPREAEVLRLLVSRSGEPVNKKYILERLNDQDVEEINIEAIEVLIHRLRKKLQHSDVQISTLRGVGYCLEPVDDDGV
ncbi:response regulator [Alcaligenaceae bacterium 429]|uniref:response regulator n=1 Tax=Paenalcaligenes sp. Me52 TaxID=3392038 RepID=UPI00109187E8|nr:response regulator [Alcaligenaceae bacterium 429]